MTLTVRLWGLICIHLWHRLKSTQVNFKWGQFGAESSEAKSTQVDPESSQQQHYITLAFIWVRKVNRENLLKKGHPRWSWTYYTKMFYTTQPTTSHTMIPSKFYISIQEKKEPSPLSEVDWDKYFHPSCLFGMPSAFWHSKLRSYSISLISATRLLHSNPFKFMTSFTHWRHILLCFWCWWSSWRSWHPIISVPHSNTWCFWLSGWRLDTFEYL